MLLQAREHDSTDTITYGVNIFVKPLFLFFKF